MDRVPTAVGALHVERHGAGPTLICWPSLFCDVRTLRPLVGAFAHDHQVILVDGPGHGQSGGISRPYTLEDCAQAAMDVLDFSAVDRATWVGSAWGGHVGVIAALRYPDRVRALVTMNAPMAPWTGRNRAMNASLYWLFRALRQPAFVAREVAYKMIASERLQERPRLADPIIDCMVHSEREPFFAAVRTAMLERPSLIPQLGSIRVPTLFIAGSEDHLFPVNQARTEAARVPGARFEVIPGTSHLSVWEAPELTVPVLTDFITRIERAESISEPARMSEERPAGY